jgi:hypothetical protein
VTTADDEKNSVVDAALAKWRQGDCVLEGGHWFVHRVEPTQAANEAEPATLAELEVPGFAVISQSCDVVRKYKDRPYVSVASLAQVADDHLAQIIGGYRPQFAAVPALVEKKLVADLDRVMTVDKRVVAEWTRTQGCANDEEIRKFSDAVKRKYGRFAFPDDFTEFVGELQDRIKEKHDKRSSEGDALRALEEIRVRAAMSWDAQEVDLMFWFIAKPENVVELRKSGVVKTWEKRILARRRFKRVHSQIVTYNELTARDYLESDRLDLDYLSDR